MHVLPEGLVRLRLAPRGLRARSRDALRLSNVT